MAFPFNVYNIAYPAAGFKSQTYVYYNMIASLSDCCSLIFLSGVSLKYPLPTAIAPAAPSGFQKSLYMLCQHTIVILKTHEKNKKQLFLPIWTVKRQGKTVYTIYCKPT